MSNLNLKKVVQAFDAISLLIRRDSEGKCVLDGTTRVALAMNLVAIRPYAEAFQKEHNDLVMKYGVKQPDNTWRVESEELLKKFTAERDKAMSVDTPVVLAPIDLKELKDCQLPIDLIAALIETGLVKK